MLKHLKLACFCVSGKHIMRLIFKVSFSRIQMHLSNYFEELQICAECWGLQDQIQVQNVVIAASAY